VRHTHQLTNCFDLLVGYLGRTFLLEVQDLSPPSAGERPVMVDSEKVLLRPLPVSAAFTQPEQVPF
jgi:hypothetical protein